MENNFPGSFGQSDYIFINIMPDPVVVAQIIVDQSSGKVCLPLGKHPQARPVLFGILNTSRHPTGPSCTIDFPLEDDTVQHLHRRNEVMVERPRRINQTSMQNNLRG